MGGNQYDGVAPRMPINRRVGVLDKVLADAVDWYVDHPLHKPWQGGERGDPYMIEETEENHGASTRLRGPSFPNLRDAITDLNYRLQETLRGEYVSDERYSETGLIEEALGRGGRDESDRRET